MKGGVKMKKIFCIIAILALTGCMTQRQYDAEKAYYEHLTAVAALQQAQPIFRMTPETAGEPIVISNVKSFEVFNPPPPLGDFARQYQHRDFTPAWVPAAFNAIAPLGFLWGSSMLVKEVGKVASPTSYNQNISGQSTATMRIQGGTQSSVSGTGNTSTVMGTQDNTATPTVVEQPPPVVLEPFVVEPTVVNPVIVKP